MSAATALPAEAPGPEAGPGARLRVLVLSRSYPNDVLDTLGLWVEQPTSRLGPLCDVEVVSPVPYCPPLPPIPRLRQYTRFRDVERTELRAGIHVHHPRFLVGPGRSLYATEASAYRAGVRSTVARIRSRFPFDLVHAHFIYPDGVVAHGLSRRYGVPFVVTEHAPWFPWLESRAVRRATLAAAADASCLLAVSHYVRDTIVRYAGDSVRVRVIPNGVDENVFFPGQQRRSDQILYAGLLNFTKGVDVLLRAMSVVNARRPEVRLLLAGGSFYRHTRLQEERLIALAGALGLRGCVTFLGPQPPREIARLMRESSVVALPSRAESFGSVLVEALASGTPVVATRAGGPEDIVEPSVGLLVPPEDPRALADALVSVLDAPAHFEPDRLRRYALRRFRWDAIARDILGVYQEAVASRDGRN